MISMRCRTFNATAGGYMRGDGCSGLLLGQHESAEKNFVGEKNLRIHKAPLNSGGLCLRMKIWGVLILIFEIYYLIIDSIYGL
jgi:hypothetical protein